MDADNLKDLIDVYLPVDLKNDMGETVKDFSRVKQIWASIRPSSGARRGEGVAELTDITHRVIVRESALRDIRTDMYFENRGLKLYVDYWMPVYNRKGFLEIYCKGVIE